jgi:hypothetical protein
MTFYEALDAFETRYLDALSVESKRVIDIFDQQWQTICNEFNCYNLAIIEEDLVAAQAHIDVILGILSDNDLTVTSPVPLPLAIGIITTPSTIPISCDSLGTPTATAYDNAYSVIKVYTGIIDDTTNWTFSVDSVSNVTANIQNDNEVWITVLSADSGSVTVRGVQTGYSDILLTVIVYKVLNGVASYVIAGFPDSIMIPDTGSGPSYANAVSYMRAIVANTDDTVNWNFAITAVSNVTANVQNGNEIWVTNISADEGYIDVEASKTGYDTVTSRIPCYTFDLSIYYTKTESDARYVRLTTNQIVAGEKTFSDAFTANSGIDVTAGGITVIDNIQLSGDILQTGVAATMDISPITALNLGQSTSAGSSFKVSVYKGDGTATLNHILSGDGNSGLCVDNGALGIGVSSPSAGTKLDVRGDIQVRADDGTIAIQRADSTLISRQYHSASNGAVLELNNNAGILNAVLRGFSTGGIQGYFNSGNIGFKETSPQETIHASGNIRVDTSGGGLFITRTTASPNHVAFYDTDGSTRRAIVGFPDTGNNVCIENEVSGGNLCLATDGFADNFYMLDAGNIGLGTTTPGDHKLAVNQTTNVSGIWSEAPLHVVNPNNVSADIHIVSFAKGSFSTDSGGIQVGPSGPQFAAPSDITLKTEIEPISKDALYLLNNIAVKEFYWKKDPLKKVKTVGYIANENEGIIDGFTGLNEETGKMFVREGVLIPYLHRAIQQLSGRVSELEKQLKKKGG